METLELYNFICNLVRKSHTKLRKNQGNGGAYKKGTTPPWLFFQLTARLTQKGCTKNLKRVIALDLSVHFNGISYDLCGVAVHKGSTIVGGHYYAYFKNGENWFGFNDLCDPQVWHVEEMREVLRSLKKGSVCAYDLLYHRRI